MQLIQLPLSFKMKVLLLAMEAQQARGLVKNKLFGVLGLFCTRVRARIRILLNLV